MSGAVVVEDTPSWTHDNVIKWKHFPRYWSFVRGIHRSPVNSPHKGQWRGALLFSFELRLNKRLSKQSLGWRFETPSCSLRRHCNASLTKSFSPRSTILVVKWFSLQRRHNERDDVSNHWLPHCLLNCWFRRRSKKTSKICVTGLCVGNSPVTGEFPAQKASNAEIFLLDGV